MNYGLEGVVTCLHDSPSICLEKIIKRQRTFSEIRVEYLPNMTQMPYPISQALIEAHILSVGSDRSLLSKLVFVMFW